MVDLLDAFVEVWEDAARPPNLGAFLTDDSVLQNAVALVELVKIDLEYRWQHGHDGRFLEDYARRHPPLLNEAGDWPLDLIYEEYHIRRQFGEDVGLDEYRQRFPQHADDLGPLLQFESADASTSLHKNGNKVRFEAGQTVDDFDLLMLLGEGAFAQVFLARQISMQRLVALKISAARGEEHKTLAQLDHPHIVRVFSQTVLEDDGLRLLYMQYHPGGTLKDVVDRMRDLPPAERTGRRFLVELDAMLEDKGASIPLNSATRQKLEGFDWPQVVCWIGARLAEALDYSHEQGVLHRDVKPANVLLAEDGSPKLADFNISFSKQIKGSSPVTHFGGSLAYMSPEQLEACDPTRDRSPDDLDARSDVYALGVLLWELLTGTRPFRDLVTALRGSQLLGEMIADRQQGPDPSGLPPETPPSLVRVLERTLAPERDKRFSSAADLARQLELCVDPEVQRVLSPPNDGLHRAMLALPSATVLIIVALCNGGMSLLNIHYNSDEIVRLSQLDLFKLQVGMLNVIAYGGGLSLLFWLMRPVRRSLKAPERSTEPGDRKARQRIIHLCYWASGISLGEWLICGILFPLGLHLTTGHAVLEDYVHFFASHVINGSLAAAAIFFLVGDFALEQMFPRIVNLDEPAPELFRSLSRFQHAVRIVLAGTICLPLVSVLLAFLLTEKNTEAFAVLALLGLVGVAGAYRWSLKLRRAAAALQTIVAGTKFDKS